MNLFGDYETAIKILLTLKAHYETALETEDIDNGKFAHYAGGIDALNKAIEAMHNAWDSEERHYSDRQYGTTHD